MFVPLDLNNKVKLLIGDRQERFELERAICLIEFQTWVYWPRTQMFASAGTMAAVFILEGIEEDIYFDEASIANGHGSLINLTNKPAPTSRKLRLLLTDKKYQQIYDFIMAERGGLTKLLYCPSPAEFDAEFTARREKAVNVTDLIEYRLRYAQHIGNSGGNINQAVFFKWWPTHDIPGRRGVTPDNKSPSPKTLFRWWSEFEKSAIFIYLSERHQFSQFPEFGDVDLHNMDPLLREAADFESLRRFFGAYAYIAETIYDGKREKPAVNVPPTVPRVEILTSPFTLTERAIINDYSGKYHLMSY